MENEPTPPQSPTPPPPDLPSPASASPNLPPPSFSPPPPAPPPPPGLMSAVEPAPKPKVTVKKDIPSDDEESVLPPAGSEAPFNPRVIAAVVDSFLAGGLYIFFSIIHLGFLGYIALIAYYLLRDALPFLNGQSLGKKAMKLKAVSLEGKSLSGDWKASAMRNLTLVIPFVNLYEIFLLWQKNEGGGKLRRLGDELAKTKVIVAAEEPDPVSPPPPVA